MAPRILIQAPTFLLASNSAQHEISLERPIFSNLPTSSQNDTSEIPYGQLDYAAGVATRLMAASIDEQIHRMGISKISSTVSVAPPAVQGVFNKTSAVAVSPLLNDKIYSNYSNGKFDKRFRFSCTRETSTIHVLFPRFIKDSSFLPAQAGAETGATTLRLMLSGRFDRHQAIQIILGQGRGGFPFFLARIARKLSHLQHELWAMNYYWNNNFSVTAVGFRDEAAFS
ncbi:hypothetical protein JHW43_006990 [Diplocarpon mali]|nr:hypothetical protein JHW43_006990 [Diplocarpon mali]